MTIEAIVRPFQTPNSAPARPYLTAGKAAPQNVILQFGRGGGGKVLNGSTSYSASFYMTQYTNEKSDASWGTAF
ncbi:hypothetical protein JQ594_15595 [Bradyrhizobium manausense]|uniref:hypothetical protein n=1 Tax=Bradyrhizobium manausense TaxID=989370 RepID=UPI001BADCF2F|nr:hypothetical protein [Bradyrhizobium manausense]MBR0687355.1 hypothetical protein [Bradyrhizobium manausense]